VLRSDVVPEVERDERQATIDVDDQSKPVGELVTNERSRDSIVHRTASISAGRAGSKHGD